MGQILIVLYINSLGIRSCLPGIMKPPCSSIRSRSISLRLLVRLHKSHLQFSLLIQSSTLERCRLLQSRASSERRNARLRRLDVGKYLLEAAHYSSKNHWSRFRGPRALPQRRVSQLRDQLPYRSDGSAASSQADTTSLTALARPSPAASAEARRNGEESQADVGAYCSSATGCSSKRPVLAAA